MEKGKGMKEGEHGEINIKEIKKESENEKRKKYKKVMERGRK
jgi:hypothetical protein